MFTNYTDEIMNEILGGAYGPVNKADDVVNFMTDWSNYISEFIQIFKDFFAGLKEALGM